MGHFSVACGISNLSIHEDDKIGFMILDKSNGRFRDARLSQNVGTSYHLYSTDLFAPFMAPVFGTYDGYGSLVDMKESKTTEILEEIFGMPASKVIESINCSRSIYTKDSEIFKNYFTGPARFTSYNATPEEALSSVGFVKSAKLSKGKTEVFVLGDYAISVRSAKPFDYWSIRSSKIDVTFVPEFQDNLAVNSLEAFAKLTGIYPGYAESSWKNISILKDLHGMFFLEDVFNEMKPYVQDPDNSFKFGKPETQQWDEFIAVMNAAEKENMDSKKLLKVLDIPRFVQAVTAFPEEHLMLLRKYEDNYGFLDVHAMMDIMTACNRMFQPSFCGEQDGNNGASSKLNRVTDKILADRRARWGEDED